jgi:hypothetical protein
MQKQKQVIVKGLNSTKRSTEAKENNLKGYKSWVIGKTFGGKSPNR